MIARFAACLSPLAALAVLPACGSEGIPLATLVDAGTSSVEDANNAVEATSGDVLTPCATNTDCAKGWFCSKPDCYATGSGTCTSIPTDPCNEQDESTECGCDGVNYFNDCLRRKAGVSKAANAQQCLPASCTISGDGGGVAGAPACPPESECAFFLVAPMVPNFNSCPTEHLPQGICWRWILPPTCHSSTMWRPCQGDPRCVNTCSAVQSGGLYVPCQ